MVWEGFGVDRTAFMGPGGSPIASIGQGPVLAGPIPVQERTFCPRGRPFSGKPVLGRASKRSSRAALDEAVVSIRAGRCKGVFMAHQGHSGTRVGPASRLRSGCS